MPKRFSLKSFNAELLALGVELVKGEGYFYLAKPLDTDVSDDVIDKLYSSKSTSIYVYAFKHMDEQHWRDAVSSKLVELGFDIPKDHRIRYVQRDVSGNRI